ncbi:carbamoyl phosphate synthase small subunit [Lacticaseibacillus daqingensis]|uniref:carbamoyl phosphate synthase small subunit n=1 Tax=Lacticaseibacillus daqingensis TaxID=2486014 RepID=UPI000F7B5FCD|nr:carbamoyl phosphate synthase small subunit [Lacticaseibacillus daqingensis]
MEKYLYLEDGTCWRGTACGAPGAVAGELVFNTSMVGYQEALTDPSYTGQLLTFTFPIIGTYGVLPDRNQSTASGCQAVILHTLEATPGPTGVTLDAFLQARNVPGIVGVDTRALTQRIRAHSPLKALLLDAPLTAAFAPVYARLTAAAKEPVRPLRLAQPGGHPHVVVVDFGAKAGIIAQLEAHGCAVSVVPPTTSLAQITALRPDGILLSNGPGDPAAMPTVLPLIRALQQRYPLVGICLGHQLLALANGARTAPLQFGHRGLNHPVTLLASGQTIMTSQNHGYTVVPASLAQTPLVVTAVEANDHTIEGLAHKTRPVFSVQYHPEAAPGPAEARPFFDQFVQLMEVRVTRHA